MGRRIRWLSLVLIVCFGLVLAQLVNVQFRRASALTSSPQNPRNLATRFDNNRGNILAADGSTVLATSVRTNGAPGTYQYQRVYPPATASLYSGITGYDSIIYGHAIDGGVEGEYNSYLEPHPQPARSLGQLLSPPSPTTDNVTLTVIPSLQAAAANALNNRGAVNKDGAVVVLNPSTGAVLAMYSNPNFDPNPLASLDAGTENAAWKADALTRDPEGFFPLAPLAYTQTFAPGSTFKVITSSAAYDKRPDLISKVYPTLAATPLPDTNQLLKNDDGFFAPCGGTIAQMLPPSCDPGFGLVGLDLGPQVLNAEATGFGYTHVPPLDLPGVVPARFPTAASLVVNRPGQAYSAIGQQDVSATALQGALEASAIADGGTIMTPHVLAQIRDSQGNLVKSYAPHPWLQATTPATASAVTGLMEGVVNNPDATAFGVGFPPQDQVAAKTGTAQAGLTNNQVNDWMIAFAPASHPRVAVAVVLPQQQLFSSGAGEAGPVMNAVIQAALAVVPPSDGANVAPPGAIPSGTTPPTTPTTTPPTTPTPVITPTTVPNATPPTTVPAPVPTPTPTPPTTTPTTPPVTTTTLPHTPPATGAVARARLTSQVVHTDRRRTRWRTRHR